MRNEEYLELLLDGTTSLEERFAQIDSHLFLSEFAKMKMQSKKIPTDARKLINKDQALENIEEFFLATAI